MICPFCQAENPWGDACEECGHALSASASIRRGSLVAGRYEVLNPLGRGGMGMVYKAHDRILDEVIALKVLRAELGQDQDLARRFRLEFKLARKVRHRNVCAIHEYGEDGGLRYICMEYLDGVDLKQLLRQKSLSSAEGYELALQVAEGLEAIHEVGIIHRDLKSSNVMRTTRGLVRLMDFGIAKQWGAEQTSTLSGGQVMGTPEYVSPEQARGERLDFRSDVYALGVVTYEIFTGDVPFRADTALATIWKHLNEPPPLRSPEAARIPEALRPVLERALAKEASERYASAAQMAEAMGAAYLASAADPASSATPVPGRRSAAAPHETVRAVPVPLSLAGDLRTMAMPDVLQWIARGRKTGSLNLERRSVRKRIAFQDGVLRSSWSNHPRESLGQFLVRDRLITEEQLFKALLKQEDQGKLLGALLVAEEVISEEQLRACLQAKAEETLYDLFLWPEGRFEFKDGDAPPAAPFPLDLDVTEVVAEGARRRERWQAIQPVVPSMQVTFASAGAPRDPDPLSAEVFALASAGRSLAEIALETRRSDFEVASSAHALCEQGVLRVDHVGDDVQAAETVGAIRDLLDIAAERLQERRYEGALEAYEAVLSLDRLNQQAKKGLISVVEAKDRERARRTIPLTKVPTLTMDLSSLAAEDFDPQEAFVLTRVNGSWDVQSMLKLCPMAAEDVLLTFARLVERKVIELR